jgi:hypothetical protein
VNAGAETGAGGGGVSRMTACVALAGAGGGGAASVVGGADRGTAWAAAGTGAVNTTIALPASKLTNKRL